ncbi:MAG: chromosomal replication initiator protein DnaA [Planctomycetota bacterium]
MASHGITDSINTSGRGALETALANLCETWVDVLEHVRTPENERGLRTWLAPEKVHPVALEDGRLVLGCPTSLMVNIIRDRYADMLRVAASEITGQTINEVVGRVSGEAYREHQRRIATQRNQQQAKTAPATEPRRPVTASWGRGFKQLRDFVVGSCNRLAYDAVMRIVDRPEDPVNPLFIHASSGLGKTHLIQGLAVAYRDHHPNCNVQYMRCEQFTNDFIAACDAGPSGLHTFRVKMRHADLLLIDDIHFLSRGQMKKSKDELFDTFNELTERGKKVVITSDAAPSDIKYLEDRFVQRFTGGLVAPLDRPDLKVRQGIVQMKAQGHGVGLRDEVVDYIADHITDNIRELEGAVNKLIYMSRSYRRQPDLALVRQALSDLVVRDGEEPRLKVILRSVADYYDLRVEDILGKSRSGPRSVARHIAMYVYKASGAETYAAVGQAFGGRSHSAVAYACEQVAKYRGEDADLDRYIEELLLRVRRD